MISGKGKRMKEDWKTYREDEKGWTESDKFTADDMHAVIALLPGVTLLCTKLALVLSFAVRVPFEDNNYSFVLASP